MKKKTMHRPLQQVGRTNKRGGYRLSGAAQRARSHQAQATLEAEIRCELRPGIGLCDQCCLPKWPQKYEGYGFMVCCDCLNAERSGRLLGATND
jgi:hypothetical protein